MSVKSKAFSYLRFSTPEQAQGDSRRRQTDLADAYARRHGLTLDAELRMEDLGVSAYRGKNLDATAKLGAFLTAIRAKDVPPGSVLLIESLDRLSRKDARKAVRVLEEIVDADVDVVTLSDGEKRYSKASLDGFDFIMAVLILMRANEESKTKGKRVAAAWAAKRTSGELLTHIVPGWVRVEADGTRKLIPERAKVVRRIFKMFTDGTGQHAIAKALNGEGVPGDKVPTFGRAKHWHRSYIHKMLGSSTVIGTMTPHTDDGSTRTAQAPIEGYFPPVIDRELWDRAQALIETNAKAPGVKSSLKVQNVLAGLAKCPHCGGAMTRVWKGAGGGLPKLACAWAKTGGVCRYVSVSLPLIEAALQRAARDPLPEADATVRDQLQNRRGELVGLEHAIDLLVNQIEVSPSKALTERLKAREEQHARLSGELAALEKRAEESESKLLKRRVQRYRAAMTAKPFDVGAANLVLREMVTKVVVDYDRATLVMCWRHDGESEIVYGVAPGELVAPKAK